MTVISGRNMIILLISLTGANLSNQFKVPQGWKCKLSPYHPPKMECGCLQGGVIGNGRTRNLLALCSVPVLVHVQVWVHIPGDPQSAKLRNAATKTTLLFPFTVQKYVYPFADYRTEFWKYRYMQYRYVHAPHSGTQPTHPVALINNGSLMYMYPSPQPTHEKDTKYKRWYKILVFYS